jgi:hypothetical protein
VFLAVTLDRRFPNPLLGGLLARQQDGTWMSGSTA